MGNSGSKSYSFERSSGSYTPHQGKFLDHSPLTVRSDCNNAFSSLAGYYNSSSSSCSNGFASFETYFNTIPVIPTVSVSSNAFVNVTIATQSTQSIQSTTLESQKQSARDRVQNKMQLINNYNIHYKEIKETKTTTTTIVIEDGKKTETQQTSETRESKEYMAACIAGEKEGHENYFLLGMGTLSNPMSTTENDVNDSVGQIASAAGGCVGGVLHEIAK